MKKFLVIRFSSIGDVLQTLSVVQRLSEEFPEDSLQLVTQTRFDDFFSGHPAVDKIWTVEKKSGFSPLWLLSGELAQENFTHIYDAHNNLRSVVLIWMLRFRLGFFRLIRRPVYRWKRFLLFRLRINRFEKPFSGQMDQIRPLKKWGVQPEIPKSKTLFLREKDRERGQKLIGTAQFIALAPSAAYPLKRWPKEYWMRLIQEWPDKKFVLLGGPEDTFLEEIRMVSPERVMNLSGQLSLMESAAVVEQSECLVSNDTGVMHMAEQLNHPCVALMGPAPFGFPSKESTRVLERELYCRPCSKHGQGPCFNPEYQKCLRDISPHEVRAAVEQLIFTKRGN